MYYRVKLEKRISKFLKKISAENRARILQEIKILQDAPVPKNKKHILALAGSCMLCELAVDKYRVYYTIENQFVVVENIQYVGTVTVLEGKSNHKSGSKKYPNQQKYIKRIIDWFKKHFSI